MTPGSFFFLPNDDFNRISVMSVPQKWPEGELMNFIGFSMQKQLNNTRKSYFLQVEISISCQFF